MEQPKIPNLAQLIKDGILDYIKQYPDRCGACPEFFNDMALDKLVDWIIYKGPKSTLIRKINIFNEVSRVTFNQYNTNVSVSVIIYAKDSDNQILFFVSNDYDFIGSSGRQYFEIAQPYLESIILKHATVSLYKNSKFKNVDTKMIYENNIATGYSLYSSYPNSEEMKQQYSRGGIGDLGITYYNGPTTPEFRNSIITFINDPKQFILQINDNMHYKYNEPKNDKGEVCRGLRLYKLYDVDYNKELLAINEINRIWGCAGRTDENEFLIHTMGFEVASDGYIEIYGTSNGYHHLFVELLFEVEDDTSDPEYDPNYSTVRYILHEADVLDSEKDLVLQIKIGSNNNQIFGRVYVQIYQREREYE